MNSKSEIINKFKKKVKLIKFHNNQYFNLDNPKISDSEYDKLKKDLISLEKKNSFLRDAIRAFEQCRQYMET